MFTRLLAAAILCELISGCRAKPPLTLSESFADTHAQQSTREAPCTVLVESVTDARSDPKILGFVDGRSVHPPTNVDAWLRNVLSGLSTRGIEVDFDARRVPEPTLLVARLSLKIAWVSSSFANWYVTVSWHLELRRGDTPFANQDFRGTEHVEDPSNGDVEVQRMLDRAFGKSLDLMAADILARCVPRS